MPRLAIAVEHAWALLDAEIRSTRNVTFHDRPTKTVREAILPELLPHLSRESITGPWGSIEISTGEAKELENMLLKHQNLLISYSRWFTELRLYRRAQRLDVEIGLLGTPARDLARQFDDPSALTPDVRATVITDALARERDNRLRSAAVGRVLGTAQDEFERYLDKVWSAGAPPHGVPDVSEARAVERLAAQLFDAVGVRRVRNRVVIDAMRNVRTEWAALVELEARLPARDPVVLGLVSAALRKPEIGSTTKAPSEDAGGRYPLDSSIRRRLFLVAKSGDGRAARISARNAVLLTIEGSAQPYGLPYPWAWAVMDLGRHAMVNIANVDTFDDLPEGLRVMGRKLASLRKAVQNSPGEQRELITEPMPYYLARLWTRTMRLCLIHGDTAPAFGVVWATLLGALVSVKQQLRSLAWEDIEDEADENLSTGLDATGGQFQTREQQRPTAVIEPGDVPDLPEVLHALISDVEEDETRALIKAVSALGSTVADPVDLVEQWSDLQTRHDPGNPAISFARLRGYVEALNARRRSGESGSVNE